MKKGIMLLEILATMLVSVLITVFIFTFIVKPAEVVGESMYPTLHNKEKILTNVFSTIFFPIERFDIVVVKTSSNPWIKRVIGLPNETVEVRNNILYINDVATPQPFLNSNVVTNDFAKITLKSDEYFVMGDNRGNSSDSRMFIQSGKHFKRSDIISRHAYVYYPFNQMRIIK